MKVLAVVTARGGSKGIPKKNIKPLAGKPLIGYTFDAAKQSKLLDRTILSTDDIRIADVAHEYGIEVPFYRPKELASDTASSLDVIKHALMELEKEGYVPDFVMILQPTSPFRTAKHIDDAIELLENEKGDSLVSVTEVPHNFSPSKLSTIKDGFLKSFQGEKEIVRRQDMPRLYARNGAVIYLFTPQMLFDEHRIFGDRLIPFVMDKIDSLDIDDMEDFQIAEAVMRYRNE